MGLLLTLDPGPEGPPPPPVFRSATILADGVTLRVVVSRGLVSGSATAGFTGTAVTINSGSYFRSTLDLTIDPVYVGDDAGTLSYGAASGDLAGVGGDVADFGPVAIENLSEVEQPPTYAVWSEMTTDGSPTAEGFVLSEGDLKATRADQQYGLWYQLRASIGKTSGRHYFEVSTAGIRDKYVLIGVGNATASLAGNAYVGANTNGLGFFGYAEKYYNSSGTAYGAEFALTGNDDMIQVDLDMDAQTVAFGLNNTWYAAVSIAGITGAVFPMASVGYNTDWIKANFGQNAFRYTPPAGCRAGVYTP